MLQIVNDAVKHFKYQSKPTSDQIDAFVKEHQLYDPDPQSEASYRKGITREVQKRLPDAVRNESQRLALHYAEDTNKPLFEIFRIILQHPKGLSYQGILNKMSKQSDIITISHYCRKLLRSNFVTVRHVKEGIIVVSRLYSQELDHKESSRLGDEEGEAEEPKTESTLYLKEFSLTRNILLNLSSVDAYQLGGLTKDDVCNRTQKQAQKKTVSRLIEGCPLYQKQGYRKGKIYEFKFRSQLEQKVQQFLENEQTNSIPEPKIEAGLLPHIEAYLQSKYPEVHAENLLLELINSHIKEYTSSIGRKECKRQCPPSKLMRYYWILNKLDEEVDTVAGLQAFIIQKQKEANVGKMHKRTLVAILEDLSQLELIVIEDSIVFPAWRTLPRPSLADLTAYQFKRPAKLDLSAQDTVRKKLHRGPSTTITERKHAMNLFASLISQELEGVYLKIMKHCFHLLKKNRRRQHEMESERASLLHILTANHRWTPPPVKSHPKDFEDVCESIDRSIAGLVKKEELGLEEEINPYIKRHLRSHFTGYTAEVVRRFGRASLDKLKLLAKHGYLSLEHLDPEQLTADQDCAYRLSLPRDIFLI